MSENKKTIILGAGVSGLSLGILSNETIYEAKNIPGGICASYYMVKGSNQRFYARPKGGNAYRFEVGGGHWLFGFSDEINNFLKGMSEFKTYQRKSGVYFCKDDMYIPYPIQNNLGYFDPDISKEIVGQIFSKKKNDIITMSDWLEKNFGSILCDKFFSPFHQLYTNGLYKTIAPQDAYKSPIDKKALIKGLSQNKSRLGYNTCFVYPKDGLDVLMRKMAERCDVRYQKEIEKIDLKGKCVYFTDGTNQHYNKCFSTLPLNKVIELAKITASSKADPHTSVLVLNIGAKKGPKNNADHWLYTCDSKAGFHRVGFYNNVDISFLPSNSGQENNLVGLYVEKAFFENQKKSDLEIEAYSQQVVEELQNLGFIGEVEVIDSSWVPVAYTWSWPNSSWKKDMLDLLEVYGIYQVGRYGRWKFQGIAESIEQARQIAKAFF